MVEAAEICRLGKNRLAAGICFSAVFYTSSVSIIILIHEMVMYVAMATARPKKPHSSIRMALIAKNAYCSLPLSLRENIGISDTKR